eukprot:1788695-Prymnesium_polylepis.1
MPRGSHAERSLCTQGVSETWWTPQQIGRDTLGSWGKGQAMAAATRPAACGGSRGGRKVRGV